MANRAALLDTRATTLGRRGEAAELMDALLGTVLSRLPGRRLLPLSSPDSGVTGTPRHAADPDAVMPAMSGRGRLQISRASAAGTPKMHSRSSVIWSLAC